MHVDTTVCYFRHSKLIGLCLIDRHANDHDRRYVYLQTDWINVYLQANRKPNHELPGQ